MVLQQQNRIVRNQRAYCQKRKKHVRSYRRKYCKNKRERLNEYDCRLSCQEQGTDQAKISRKKRYQTETGQPWPWRILEPGTKGLTEFDTTSIQFPVDYQHSCYYVNELSRKKKQNKQFVVSHWVTSCLVNFLGKTHLWHVDRRHFAFYKTKKNYIGFYTEINPPDLL